ncbi:MAG: nitroreductase family protein [Endomicrobium sp.]|jgi:nitroreductase|nr:nitroreductase family protein [Endomicrobium sp.]
MSILFDRTSVRKYLLEEVKDEDLNFILKAAMSAPTARNTRCWSFIVIKNKETHKKIAQVHKAAQMVLEAPLAILVTGDEDLAYEKYLPQDCAAAIQNILLAAAEKGYGSVWCGIYGNEERMDAFTKLFDLPANIKPFGLAVIGKSAIKPTQKERWSPEKIKYEAWK